MKGEETAPLVSQRRLTSYMAVIGTLSLIASAVVLVRLTSSDASDILRHNSLLLEAKSRGVPLGAYSVYYNIIDVLAVGNYGPRHLRWVAVWVLAAAMALKAIVSFAFLLNTKASLHLAALGTAFVMIQVPLNLDLGYIYKGEFTGTIWHNSTTIVLIPASVALFWLAVSVMSRTSISFPWMICLAIVTAINAALKPNYVLTLLPGLGIAVVGWMYSAWQRNHDRRELLHLLGGYLSVAIPAVVVLAMQYVLTYERGGLAFTIGFEPFAVWRSWSRVGGIPLSLVESFLLPLVVTASLWHACRRSRMLQVAWLCVGVGLFNFAVFAEYGPQGELLLHGNWIWGAQVSTFILYLVCTSLWISEQRGLRWAWIRWMVHFLASVQFLWGVVYLVRLVSTRNYL